MKKLIRTSTVALSLDYLLKGQLKFLSSTYEVVAVAGQDDHLENVAQREGVRVVNLPMQRAISPLKDLVSLWHLYRLFKKEKPDIVHSITPKAGLLSMLAAKFAGVPVRIHTFTGLIFPAKAGIMQKVLIEMDRLLCWAAITIIPEGQGVKNDLINYKITSKPLKVLANGNVNGIDTSFFDKTRYSESTNQSLKEQLNIETGDFVFIFVGRLVGDKGINDLITAFKNLSSGIAAKNSETTTIQTRHLTPDQHPSPITPHPAPHAPKLLLVGSFEPELDPLKPETLAEIETNPNIIALGFQQEVRPYFAIADALVFPSYREGFPNVVLQAGAMGLPSIVSDINGCNEIIENGCNGLIVPVKNTNALADAMRRLHQDLHLYQQLEQQARPKIVARYEQAVVWQAILEEYRSVTGEKR